MSLQSLKQQHRSARSILSARKLQRKKEAMALAELILDVYKEKKVKEAKGLNNAQSSNN